MPPKFTSGEGDRAINQTSEESSQVQQDEEEPVPDDVPEFARRGFEGRTGQQNQQTGQSESETEQSTPSTTDSQFAPGASFDSGTTQDTQTGADQTSDQPQSTQPDSGVAPGGMAGRRPTFDAGDTTQTTTQPQQTDPTTQTQPTQPAAGRGGRQPQFDPGSSPNDAASQQDRSGTSTDPVATGQPNTGPGFTGRFATEGALASPEQGERPEPEPSDFSTMGTQRAPSQDPESIGGSDFSTMGTQRLPQQPDPAWLDQFVRDEGQAQRGSLGQTETAATGQEFQQLSLGDAPNIAEQTGSVSIGEVASREVTDVGDNVVPDWIEQDVSQAGDFLSEKGRAAGGTIGGTFGNLYEGTIDFSADTLDTATGGQFSNVVPAREFGDFAGSAAEKVGTGGGGLAATPADIASLGIETTEATTAVTGELAEGDFEGAKETATAVGTGATIVGARAAQGAIENPFETFGSAAAGFGVGGAAGRIIQRVPDVGRSASIRARGGDIVDFDELSDAPTTTSGGLPAFSNRVRGDPDAARSEFIEQASATAIGGDDPVIFSGRGASDVAEFGRFGPEFEAPEGASELPGLFQSADLSGLRVPEAGGTGGYSVGLPRPRFRSGRVLAEESPDIGIVPDEFAESGYAVRGPDGDIVETGLGRGAANQLAEGTGGQRVPDPTTAGFEFFSEVADPNQSFIRGRGDITPEQEAVAPPGAGFSESGGVFGVRRGGFDIPFTDRTIGGTITPGRIVRRQDTDAPDADVDAPTRTLDDVATETTRAVYQSRRVSEPDVPVTPVPGVFGSGSIFDSGTRTGTGTGGTSLFGESRSPTPTDTGTSSGAGSGSTPTPTSPTDFTSPFGEITNPTETPSPTTPTDTSPTPSQGPSPSGPFGPGPSPTPTTPGESPPTPTGTFPSPTPTTGAFIFGGVQPTQTRSRPQTDLDKDNDDDPDPTINPAGQTFTNPVASGAEFLFGSGGTQQNVASLLPVSQDAQGNPTGQVEPLSERGRDALDSDPFGIGDFQ